MPWIHRVLHVKRLPIAAALAACAVACSTSALAQSHPPVANPGGPYLGTAGSSILLDGSNSFDPDGDPLNFSWDLSGSGNYTDSNLARPTFYISAAAPLGTTYPVGLRVLDPFGRFDVKFTTVTVASSVPEPATFALFAIGLVCLAAKFQPSRHASADRESARTRHLRTAREVARFD